MQPSDSAAMLKQIGAPANVVAWARLMGLAAQSTTMERTAATLQHLRFKVEASGFAPFQPLPQIDEMLLLDQALPPALRMVESTAPRHAAMSPGWQPAAARAPKTVVRVLEALTPPIEVPASFANAVKVADDPAQWAVAAPQISVPQNSAVPLPANGALNRWRLTKCTDLLKPIPGLATEETIEITAEGRHGPGGSGTRRYSHVLVSAVDRAELLRLTADTGWIELSGNSDRCLLRLQKRIVVEVPSDLNDDFGALLPTALCTLLWLWALGFTAAVQPAQPRIGQGLSGKQKAAANLEPKSVAPQSDGSFHVAVLGGGPAGLACAWLLSNPTYCGKPAWAAPQGKVPLDLSVTLLEKECRLGGKAASGRRTDGQSSRIEEHGLHVLMGFYMNTLGMLETLGVQARLHDVGKTLVVPADWNGATAPWPVTLGPWKNPVAPAQSPAEWLRSEVGMQPAEWERLGLHDLMALRDPDQSSPRGAESNDAFALHATAGARPVAPPLMRAFLDAWKRVAKLKPEKLSGDSDSLDNLSMQLMLRKLMLADYGKTAQSEASAARRSLALSPDLQQPGERIGPLASNLRELAREALGANNQDPDISLASEILELTMTIAKGLDDADLVPTWALNCPKDLVAKDELCYQEWAQSMQALDTQSLAEWLVANGADPGFPQRSRVLAAVTAGLFTTPDQIGAGTCINGLARLLFTYDDAPYKLMPGGTGEAVIGPLYDALLLTKRVVVRAGTSVKSLYIKGGVATSAQIKQDKKEDVDAYKIRPPGVQKGWPAPPACTEVETAQAEDFAADAFVLANPPFGGALAGLPDELTLSLNSIESCATLAVQHWTDGAPRYPDAIMSGLQAPVPLRCAAAMNHLAGDEGSNFQFAPVYYCGDIDEAAESRLRADRPAFERAIDEWLETHAAWFQQGTRAHPTYTSINYQGSERYVCANSPTQKARRYVFETAVSNLWLAGDWTRTALSCGSIEAAITSGLEAARDILQSLGCKVDYPIVGASFTQRTTA